MEDTVPNTHPTTPITMMRQFFSTHTGRGNTRINVYLLSPQKVSRSIPAGKMSASNVLARAPIRLMRSSRKGMAMAIIAVCAT